MSCQCYQIGGPFIAEDPHCVVHGEPAQRRRRAADDLLDASEREDITVEELREIVDQLHSLATELES